MQWRRKMICSGVAKKTIRAEIASSVYFTSIILLFVFHINGTPATPVPTPLSCKILSVFPNWCRAWAIDPFILL